jgi:hypothetical protein
MTDTDAAKKVELAQKHINYQRQRIVRQKELITQLARDHKTESPTGRLRSSERSRACPSWDDGRTSEGATTGLKLQADGVE